MIEKNNNYSNLETILNKVLENPRKLYEEVASHLPQEEYQLIKQELEDKNCQTCRNRCCRVESYEKPVENCVGYENKGRIGKAKVLSKKYNN